MDSTLFRLVGHLSLFALITVGMSTLWLVRGRYVRLTHVPLALAALGLFALWLMLLALSIRDMRWLTRDTLIWPLTVAELGASFLGWAWWAIAVKKTFRYERRKQSGDGIVAQ